MGSLIRSVLAVAAGLAVAVALITAFETAGSWVFPLPAGVDPTDAEALRAAAGDLSAGTFVFVLAGWATGSLAGAWVAGRIAGHAPLIYGMGVALLLLILGVMTMLTIPHPVWVWLAGIAAFLGCGYMGARLAARARPAA